MRHGIAFTLLMVASTLTASASGNAQIDRTELAIPQMGEPADASLSPREEMEIGSRITTQLYRAGFILEDPELTDYIAGIGWNIASRSGNLPQQLTFFVVRDPRINAFALPGGYMGFNAGLIMAARTESELAGVVAHELAHVTQRHIARSIEGTRVSNIATWATVLAAIIAGSAAPDVVIGALALGQAATYQQQVNFTRAHELEADRLGIRTMAQAGYNPEGMVSFFQRLEQQSRLYGSGLPEILRTHPVNTTRISEARARAAEYEGQPVTERTVEFRIMQARSRVLTSARPSQALEYYSQRMDSGIEGIGERYGAALAMAELGNFEPAREVLKPALEQAPRQASLLLLNARILAGLRQDEAALAEYRTVIEHHPRYAPALLALAETLMDQGAHGEARQHLLDNLTALRDHADTHRLLARAAREVDDTAELAYQSAAFAWHRGDAPTALSHLDAGLRVASLSAQERARLTAFRRDLRGTLPNNWRPQEP
jgi:predicted Zn-dependent protease